jgi:hypothetical protein
MALSNYSELKSSIANWLNRSDLTSEIANDFIVLAEKDFNSKLRIRKMVNQTSLTLNAETVALPTAFLQVRDFYILSGSTKYSLTYMTPSQMDQVKGSSMVGMPTSYTILGDTFRFSPVPGDSYTAYLNYYKTFDALSDSNTTNFILTNHPSIYLYGSLYHAAQFLGGVDPNRVQQWLQLYSTALERLEQNDREDQFSGSPLQIRSDVTVAGAFSDTTKVSNNNNN